MKLLINLSASLVRKINDLVARSEKADPEMPEAAMVYVGDVYVLRELRVRRHADGWGRRRYSCESGRHQALP